MLDCSIKTAQEYLTSIGFEGGPKDYKLKEVQGAFAQVGDLENRGRLEDLAIDKLGEETLTNILLANANFSWTKESEKSYLDKISELFERIIDDRVDFIMYSGDARLIELYSSIFPKNQS